MKAFDFLAHLHFHDQLLLNENVDFEQREVLAVEYYRHADFLFGVQSFLAKYDRERLPRNELGKARSEFVVRLIDIRVP